MLFRSVLSHAPTGLCPSHEQLGNNPFAITRLFESRPNASKRSITDRKSTRLNSSHSLYDAFPICPKSRAHRIVPESRATRKQPICHNAVIRKPTQCQQKEHYRSEEHTSELQSLTIRCFSDLS